jgi:hypothetical protein
MNEARPRLTPAVNARQPGGQQIVTTAFDQRHQAERLMPLEDRIAFPVANMQAVFHLGGAMFNAHTMGDPAESGQMTVIATSLR